jgi:hypothetical protein
MRNVILTIALVATLGLVAGCSGLGCGCEPDPCCEPVYASPCCPAPSQGVGYTGGGSAGGGGASCGAGKACGG